MSDLRPEKTELVKCGYCGAMKPAGLMLQHKFEDRWFCNVKCLESWPIKSEPHRPGCGCSDCFHYEGVEGYVEGLGLVRECIDCACLTPGGPTRCKRCAKEKETVDCPIYQDPTIPFKDQDSPYVHLDAHIRNLPVYVKGEYQGKLKDVWTEFVRKAFDRLKNREKREEMPVWLL